MQVCFPKPVRRARTGRGMSCSPETAQGRVGRRVPALCVLASATSPPVQVWASCEHLVGSPQHPSPSSDPFVSLSPIPICLPVRSPKGFRAHDPARVPLAVALAAQPRPGAPERRKS